MTLGKLDFIRLPNPAAKMITPTSFMMWSSKGLKRDYNETRSSIKVRPCFRYAEKP